MYTIKLIKVNKYTLTKTLNKLKKLGYTTPNGSVPIKLSYVCKQLALRYNYICINTSQKFVFNGYIHTILNQSFITLKELESIPNEQILATFLKEYRKYTAFKRYLIAPVPTNEHIKHVLTDFTTWSETKEGYTYWDNLDQKWRKLVKHFNIKGTINLKKL